MTKSNIKAFTLLAALVMTFVAFSASAQETGVDAVFVSSSSANIRQQPSTSAKIVGKAYYNDCFEMLGQEGDWLKILNPFTGEPAYLSTSVASEGSFLMECTPLYTSFKDSSTSYSATECKGKGSNEKCYTTSWNFTYPENKFLGPVIICKTEMITDAAGRSHSNEYYLKGISTPANIFVSEECDMDGNSSGLLDHPFIISHITGMDEEGVVSKGTVYNFEQY
mgnify:CR=1 FL=1